MFLKLHHPQSSPTFPKAALLDRRGRALYQPKPAFVTAITPTLSCQLSTFSTLNLPIIWQIVANSPQVLKTTSYHFQPLFGRQETTTIDKTTRNRNGEPQAHIDFPSICATLPLYRCTTVPHSPHNPPDTTVWRLLLPYRPHQGLEPDL